MKLTYETKRLRLCVLNENDAPLVLRFFEENRDFFAAYEPAYPDNYFTVDYQAMLLNAYMQQFLKTSGMRYFLFEKDHPQEIIGCIAFQHLRLGEEKSCSVCYKLAKAHQGHGYATEALIFLLQVLVREFSMHRVEADILPENTSSVHFAVRLGFEYEGIARHSHRIQGVWRNHARYALLLE